MPLLSIIIPTHNRAHYAVPTIRSVLSISPDIEVIVSDTSEEDRISENFINDPDWPRVRLIRPAAPLSVVDNFNEGLRQACGDYLLFLGDDDFVSPTVIDLVGWAQRHTIDAIQLSFPALYYWPDFIHKRRGHFYSGTLQLQHFTGSVILHDAMRALEMAMEDFGGGVGAMPRAYAGIVSRVLCENIVAKHGALFGGVSPDIYSAALIASEAKRCVHVDFPIVVPGSSGASTAGQSARGKHIGKLRDNPHIGAFKDLVWADLIPEFYSVPTVWSFSLLRAMERLGIQQSANYGRLYARCIFYHRGFITDTLASMRKWRAHIGTFKAAVQLGRGIAAETRWVAGKILRMLFGRLVPSPGQHVIRELIDSQSACHAIGAWLVSTSARLELDEFDDGPRNVASIR